jgi:hypothetical protein
LPYLNIIQAKKIVKVVLTACSIICEILVGTIFERPWKYPLKVQETAVKNMVGESAKIVIKDSGEWVQSHSCFANTAVSILVNAPMEISSVLEILSVL